MTIRPLLLIVAMIFTPAMYGMQLQPAQNPIGTQNQVQSDKNMNKFQNQPYFTLAVLQPATGYVSLENYAKAEAQTLKSHGYGLIPFKNWHLSVIVFAVPFLGGKVDPAYVQQALDALEDILKRGQSVSVHQNVLQALTDVTLEYTGLESIGTHKFLVAKFERKPGTKAFFRVYGDIVRSFFNIYPNSWMYYGYGMVPHVSVASKMKGAKVAGPTRINALPPQPVQDIKLRHQGHAYQRKLHINARWRNPSTKKMEELKSHGI